MNKPIQLQLEEAREELIKSINDITDKYALDPYFLEFIMKDIYKEIVSNTEKELARIKASLEKEEETKKKEVKKNEKQTKA